MARPYKCHACRPFNHDRSCIFSGLSYLYIESNLNFQGRQCNVSKKGTGFFFFGVDIGFRLASKALQSVGKAKTTHSSDRAQ